MQFIIYVGFGDKIKILLVFDKVFWPNIEVFGTEVELHGYPLFFINLHKIHGLKALLGTIGGSIVYEAEKENDDDIVTKSKFNLSLKKFYTLNLPITSTSIDTTSNNVWGPFQINISQDSQMERSTIH